MSLVTLMHHRINQLISNNSPRFGDQGKSNKTGLSLSIILSLRGSTLAVGAVIMKAIIRFHAVQTINTEPLSVFAFLRAFA